MNKEERKEYMKEHNKQYRLTHKRNTKTVVLASGNKEGAHWNLTLEISVNTKTFNGHFKFREKYKEIRRTVHLATGSEEGARWDISMHIAPRTKVFIGVFSFIDAFKVRVRDKDRRWVLAHIPMSKNMEVHHDWKEGGRAYLLTCAEHRALHKMEVI